jgi:hypothetical protein
MRTNRSISEAMMAVNGRPYIVRSRVRRELEGVPHAALPLSSRGDGMRVGRRVPLTEWELPWGEGMDSQSKSMDVSDVLLTESGGRSVHWSC